MNRNQVAHEAFYGNLQDVADYVRWELRYEMNGETFPANGFSLSECIEVVAQIPEETLDMLVA